ncbi:SLBB domain-containing protein [Lusitaniella coriacea LEGE 07157]|uniref:SLBB domain-containing protein n=1 Tax=Lusitaniella coriacea LEGE 07157 TaxID=945747 RepID=A0A8J7DW70_9CYAN|nr:SLBB domain-containing protein [Lusitaniella coriacea]MBE9116271.1 SLBB domain-containing protein [Lusitaniella coriacea LEGE 07157]
MKAIFRATITRRMLPIAIATLTAAPSFAQLPNLPASYPPPIPQSTGGTTQESVYLLGGGDRLAIDVFEVPQYSGQYQVPVDGIIYLPLIGAVKVGGLTIQQASERISQQYAVYLKRPFITIRLLNTRPLNVFVAGEVVNAGSFSVDLIGGAGDNPGVQFPTLTEALKRAGGVTLTADISQIQVRRRTSIGGEESFIVDLKDRVKSGAPPLVLTLRDGDSIFVPTATEVDLGELRDLAKLDFAANVEAGRTISVVGEVERPGTYYIQLSNPGVISSLPTVTIAIQEAGGIEPLADVRNIQIRRQTKSGTEQLLAINLWELLQTGDVSQDTVLQDGDTIIVPKASELSAAETTELATARFSPDSIQVSVVGEVERPGLVNLPPNTPLIQGLMTAGGFNDARANRNEVRLIRLNPDGSVVSRELDIDITDGVNEQSNPLLRDNDIIVIERNQGTRISDTLTNLLTAGSNALAWFSIPSRIFGILETLGIIDNNNDNNN